MVLTCPHANVFRIVLCTTWEIVTVMRGTNEVEIPYVGFLLETFYEMSGNPIDECGNTNYAARPGLKRARLYGVAHCKTAQMATYQNVSMSSWRDHDPSAIGRFESSEIHIFALTFTL